MPKLRKFCTEQTGSARISSNKFHNRTATVYNAIRTHNTGHRAAAAPQVARPQQVARAATDLLIYNNASIGTRQYGDLYARHTLYISIRPSYIDGQRYRPV